MQRFSYPGPLKSICTITSYNQKLKCHRIPNKNNHAYCPLADHMWWPPPDVSSSPCWGAPGTYPLSMPTPFPEILPPGHTHLPLDIRTPMDIPTPLEGTWHQAYPPPEKTWDQGYPSPLQTDRHL